MTNKIAYPEDDPYCLENVPLFEALYGKNLISLGGGSAIDHMFSDLKISNLKALDLGFGLGGVAYYLAKKYAMPISGIEVHPWMVQHALQHIPEDLAPLLEFTTYNAQGQIPYADQTFDLVYSKGVLNHVSDKGPLFKQVYSVLKPGGLFVIADWIVPGTTAQSAGPLVNETKQSYEQVLTSAGFERISFRDESTMFLNYVENFIDNLHNQKEWIALQYSDTLFTTILQQHQDLRKKLQDHEKIAIRIVTTKALL